MCSLQMVSVNLSGFIFFVGFVFFKISYYSFPKAFCENFKSFSLFRYFSGV